MSNKEMKSGYNDASRGAVIIPVPKTSKADERRIQALKDWERESEEKFFGIPAGTTYDRYWRT